jgi:hypothetical protein
MADTPENDGSEASNRRSREAARRDTRQRRMNIVGTALTVAVVVLVALVATDTLRVGGRGPTLASARYHPTTTTVSPDATKAIARIKTPKSTRPLSNAAPLRLWVGGDSLSGDLGYQLGPMLAKLGIVKAHVDYKVSSGLASNNVRNWPENFGEEQAQYQPETVIFMVGANDAPIVGSAVDSTGTPVWETKYRAKVDTMMDLLVGGLAQRTVFWIGSPTLGNQYNHGAEEVDRVMQEEASKHPTVVYIDAYALFAVNGKYARSLPDANGNEIQMRVGDGVHFTVDGAKYLATHVFTLLDSRWNLTTQAAPDTPIPYTIEPSSGTIGGVHLGSGSNNGGSNGSNNSNTSGSTTTLPPVATTAPTTTTPKVAPTTTTPKVAPTTTVPHTTTPTTGAHGPSTTTPGH